MRAETYWSFTLAIWEAPKHVSIRWRNAEKVSRQQWRAEYINLRVSTLNPRLPDDPLFIALSSKDGVSFLGTRLTAEKIVEAVILDREFSVIEQGHIPLYPAVSGVYNTAGRGTAYFFARVIFLDSSDNVGFVIRIGEDGEVPILDIGYDVSSGIKCRHSIRHRIL